MERFLPVLFVLIGLRATAQGDCSIELLSPYATSNQGSCNTTLTHELTPIVYLIQGSGLQVTNLPPGVTYTFINDTLTISGTISGPGYYSLYIVVGGGCTAFPSCEIVQEVDPQFGCTVVEEGVLVSWPGLNTPMSIGGNVYLDWYAGDLSGGTIIHTPCEQSFTFAGLPADVPIQFQMYTMATSECFAGSVLATCMIATGVEEQADHLPLRAVLLGDRLELTAGSLLKDVRIHNAMGQLLVAHRANGTSVHVPVDGLPAGPFIVTARDEADRSFSQRFMKP